MIVESQHKRVWGRLTAYDEVDRIVSRLGPIIREAAAQESVQAPLRQMARDSGISLSAMMERWIRLHEADILLESGGREDAVSVSDAVGVSQWLAGTARGAGLRVDLATSNRLTGQIDALIIRAASPAVDDSERARIRGEIESLRVQRRVADNRYDPRLAIMAQARYLLRLYPRYPDPAWMMQAYHGGELGVTRTLSKYLGTSWPGTAAGAIRSGRRGGRLSFEHLYLTTTPRGRPDAFSYLYGRSDDHRYYWWKIRSALEAFSQYRANRQGFRQRWERFLPGRAKEAYWYPAPPARSASSSVVSGKYYVAANHGVVSAETKGALLLVAELYHRHGVGGKLTIGDMLLTEDVTRRIQELAAIRDARRRRGPPAPRPSAWPGGGPLPEFNYHTTGLALDIARPSDPLNRKKLEYALGWLADRHILWWRTDDIDSRGTGRRHYHIMANPIYRNPLARIGRTGKLPRIP